MFKLSAITKNILVVCLFVVCFFPLSTQAVQETTIGGSLIANLSPKYPKPNEMVTISLIGYGVNLDDSRITWLVDDKVQSQGVAKTEFIVTLGPLGSKTKVNALIQTRTNRTIAKELIFQPAEVDLLYEADTYVPSDYKGAPLPTLGTPIKVVAIPQMMYLGSFLRPETITYEWRANGRKLNNESGRGKDSLNFIMPNKKATIEVVVKSFTYGLDASQKITIDTVEPEIILYPVKPLEGRSAIAIKDSIEKITDTSIKAEPYFINKNSLQSGLVFFNWLVDGKKIIDNIANTQGLLNLSIPETREDNISMTIDVTDSLNKLKPKVSKNFNLKIENSSLFFN
jgi:hypothetical protein